MTFDPLTFKPKAQLLQLETSTACNANCLFCMHPQMKRKGNATWKTILNTLYWHSHRVSQVCPFGMQEPTLEPRLPAILAQIKQFNRKTSTLVYTNLSKFDVDYWTKILKWGVLDTLAVSFYGVNKRTYERMQPPLKYDKVTSNIKQLMKLKKRLGVRKPEVNLHMMIIPETYKQCQSFFKRWNGKVDNVGFVRWDSWCGNKPYSNEFEERFWGKSETERYPCPRLWRIMTVHYDGTIVPCCLDYDDTEPCGNINIDHEAWYTNERLETLRMMHLRGEQDKIPLCKDCTVWRRDHDKVWNELWQNKKLVSSVNSLYTK